jgi:hypothetical protein
VTVAPSITPPDAHAQRTSQSSGDVDLTAATDALCDLGILLQERLTGAADVASAPGDRAACLEAARAACQIRDLMARDDHADRSR